MLDFRRRIGINLPLQGGSDRVRLLPSTTNLRSAPLSKLPLARKQPAQAPYFSDKGTLMLGTPGSENPISKISVEPVSKCRTRAAIWFAVGTAAMLGLLIAGARLRTHTVLAAHGLPRAGGARGTPGVTTFDVPGAGTGMLQGTVAVGIDAAGDVWRKEQSRHNGGDLHHYGSRYIRQHHPDRPDHPDRAITVWVMQTLTPSALCLKIDRSGPVAQLGARFHGMEEVIGSIPIRSTN